MTNFELAQTLVRLGAVTALGARRRAAVDAAFDGTLLNRPSDPAASGRSRRSLQSSTSASTRRRPCPSLSPNGDGVDERSSSRTRSCAPSTVTATLVAPDGTSAVRRVDRARSRAPTAFRLPPTDMPARPPRAAGSWKSTATDDQARTSTADATFTVNITLGVAEALAPRARRAPSAASSRRGRRDADARRARARVTVETRTGASASPRSPCGALERGPLRRRAGTARRAAAARSSTAATTSLRFRADQRARRHRARQQAVPRDPRDPHGAEADRSQPQAAPASLPPVPVASILSRDHRRS